MKNLHGIIITPTLTNAQLAIIGAYQNTRKLRLALSRKTGKMTVQYHKPARYYYERTGWFNAEFDLYVFGSRETRIAAKKARPDKLEVVSLAK